MRLSDEAKQQAKQKVSPRNFWVAIAAAIVLLTIIGVYLVPLEHSPAARWMWGAVLLAVWSINLWRLFRFGRRALPWSQAALLVGLTLLSAQEIWPHTPAAGAWTEPAGMGLALIGVLAPYLVWSRRPKNSPGAS